MALRRIVVFALLGAGLAACHRGKEAAAGGEVIGLEGKVTAKRGDAPARTLAVGDAVHGDDLIATGESGEVVIRLARNHLTVTLGPNIERRLDETVAWNASGKVGGSVLDRDPDDRTAAAGRHGGKEAATDPSAVLSEKKGRVEDSEAERETTTVEVKETQQQQHRNPSRPGRGSKHGAGDGAGNGGAADERVGQGGDDVVPGDLRNAEETDDEGDGDAEPAPEIAPAVQIIAADAAVRSALEKALGLRPKRLAGCAAGHELVVRLAIDVEGRVSKVDVIRGAPAARRCAPALFKAIELEPRKAATRATVRFKP